MAPRAKKTNRSNRVDSVRASKDWDWDHLVESIIESRPEAVRTLLSELLSQFERAYPKRPHVETVSKMRSQVATASGCEPLCDELDRLLARSTQARRVQRGNDRANYVPATRDTRWSERRRIARTRSQRQ